mgnify:CR=1 FL=1|jgi:hypothetical protein
MTNAIIIQLNSLERFYDQVMDDLVSKYHTNPSYSLGAHLDKRLISEKGYYGRMAQDVDDQNHAAQDVLLGKLGI